MAGSSVEIIPTECFVHIVDEDGLMPPITLTAPGYYQRIKTALDDLGIASTYEDRTKRREFTPNWAGLKDFSFRYRQEECLRLITESPYGRIQCPTGYGKTFLLLALCLLYPKARIDITTHSNDVLQMIYDDLSSELPASVGIMTGKTKDPGYRIMCYSGKSLHRSDGKADFLFVDECHEFATSDYLARVARYKRSRNYGFSANKPGDRMDGADFELEGAFGPVLIEIPYEEAVAHNCIVQVKVQWEDVVMDLNPCEDKETLESRIRWGIWRNFTRNEKIAKVAQGHFDEGKQVLVVVDTIEHACFLKKELPDFEMMYSDKGFVDSKRQQYIDWGLIDNDEPEMTWARRIEMTKAFERGELRGVIATGVWNRGVNFRQLQVLVRADGKSSPIADAQIPGRLSRLSEGKRYGLLVDFYDQFDSTFQRRATDRKNRYRKMKWEQIEPDRKSGTDYHQQSLYADG